ncbi:BTAD domain-containing putative transcriptional regulator [Adlercreutzia sp. R21]|uniref:BTAD domain-containing putative transcriptional regulator n=1 Tax=Adlercreutzia wanghongyangiae TaxID=3111451 RepID=A0ABU6IJL9_9ACTN|nr:BTAD domain-containing putative transcriptional regulator [Adlercreutzia sp. R21]MEC4176663.1 BTAD domain-containing putative transcriptional regulator [Adlercreutzia sp. R7]MEC4183654.1 BTAD domain-containing putative transcriptional regulator [Adlercreutzia sp. R21]
MSRFILQSACRGRCPAGAAPRRHVSRPHLISRLLSDRRALRVLSAPDGFGKTALACEYAEVVFGFQRVFWVNGQSPCFLRDLDAGVIVASLLQEAGACALVVIDDMPWMDETRAQSFGLLAQELLDAGVEVLVTATPGCDCLDGLEVSCLRIAGRDLLVADDENEGGALGAVCSPGDRIPCLHWSERGEACLVAGIAREPLPADFRLALWVMLALGRGDREDAALFLGQARAREAWDYLAPRYPFAVIDGDDGAFEAVPVAPAVLREGLGGCFEEAAAASVQGDRDALALAAARWLIGAGRASRGAQLMGAFASKSAVAAWLPREGAQLLWQGAAAPLCELHDRVCRQRVADRSAVNAMMAGAFAQIGDDRAVLEFARKALGTSAVPSRSGAAAALAAHRRGNRATRTAMGEALARWREHNGTESAAAGGEDAALALLVDVALAEERPHEALRAWVTACTAGGEVRWDGDAWPQGLLLAAAWTIDALAATGVFEPRHGDPAFTAAPDFALLASVTAGALDDLAASGVLGWGGTRAAQALERIEEALRAADLPVVSRAAMRVCAREEAERAALVAAYGRRRSQRSLSMAPAPGAVSGIGRRPAETAVPLLAPPLHVRLFGAMTVRIGDAEVSSRILARKKARLLLALLVLYRGRELTREALVSMLWPQASPRTGAKSFYRLWAELADLLSVDGHCPYLLRDHHRCQVNPALCTSDVMEFEALGRTLLFGLSGAATGWENVLCQVQESFSGELLPDEDHCEVVADFRRRYATELVDGLVAASCRLRAAGELQGALWFAREALRRDGTREDVYACLMAVQMMAGQRGGALDTFFACRDYLAGDLGLDPSPQIMDLYHRLIEGGPAVRAARQLS